MPEPIKIWAHQVGPNPWKVIIIMEELGIPYLPHYIDLANVKDEPYISLNPNGRLPTIEDPNTGVKVWESGAVIEYLLETYDTENKLSYTTSPEKWEQSSWKHLQMSGQGPPWGQKLWFSKFSKEKAPLAIDRFANEIRRVLSVLELHLKRTGRPYLVGDKACYADLMFIPWNNGLNGWIMDDGFNGEWEKDYPLTWAWHQKLLARPAVKKALEIQIAAKKAAGKL